MKTAKVCQGLGWSLRTDCFAPGSCLKTLRWSDEEQKIVRQEDSAWEPQETHSIDISSLRQMMVPRAAGFFKVGQLSFVWASVTGNFSSTLTQLSCPSQEVESISIPPILKMQA